MLSNLTAGNCDQLQSCIDGGLIDQLSQILIHDDASVKMEAVWALSNATAIAKPAQFKQMVDKGLIKALVQCMKI